MIGTLRMARSATRVPNHIDVPRVLAIMGR